MSNKIFSLSPVYRMLKKGVFMETEIAVKSRRSIRHFLKKPISIARDDPDGRLQYYGQMFALFDAPAFYHDL